VSLRLNFRSLPLEFRSSPSRSGDCTGYECRQKEAYYPQTLALLHSASCFSRGHAIVGVVARAVILLVLFLYRLGFVDRYVAGPDQANVCELRHPRRDQRVSRQLPTSDRRDGRHRTLRLANRRATRKDRSLVATIRIEDLYALNLQRNINLRISRSRDLKHGSRLTTRAAPTSQHPHSSARAKQTHSFCLFNRERRNQKWRGPLRRRASRHLRRSAKLEVTFSPTIRTPG
jgi:hypothetical protein